MATLKCPNCGAAVATSDGWARAAMSTLAQSPAVPGMANQVRCTGCQQVFAEPAGSGGFGWGALWPAAALLVVLLAVAALV